MRPRFRLLSTKTLLSIGLLPSRCEEELGSVSLGQAPPDTRKLSVIAPVYLPYPGRLDPNLAVINREVHSSLVVQHLTSSDEEIFS